MYSVLPPFNSTCFSLKLNLSQILNFYNNRGKNKKNKTSSSFKKNTNITRIKESEIIALIKKDIFCCEIIFLSVAENVIIIIKPNTSTVLLPY